MHKGLCKEHKILCLPFTHLTIQIFSYAVFHIFCDIILKIVIDFNQIFMYNQDEIIMHIYTYALLGV